ncbi:MAG TPA: hypothetical protein VGL75_00475 [Acidothermaceae bacterium]|jgi:DNA invertase Pin-like site-specific DNA recombinase
MTRAGYAVEAVASAVYDQRQADRQLRRAVETARAAGVTWEMLADVFGISRQAVTKRFTRRPGS